MGVGLPGSRPAQLRCRYCQCCPPYRSARESTSRLQVGSRARADSAGSPGTCLGAHGRSNGCPRSARIDTRGRWSHRSLRPSPVNGPPVDRPRRTTGRHQHTTEKHQQRAHGLPQIRQGVEPGAVHFTTLQLGRHLLGHRELRDERPPRWGHAVLLTPSHATQSLYSARRWLRPPVAGSCAQTPSRPSSPVGIRGVASW